jgi:hypothetical protein
MRSYLVVIVLPALGGISSAEFWDTHRLDEDSALTEQAIGAAL